MSRFAIQGAYVIKSAHEIVENAYVVVEDQRIKEIVSAKPEGLEILGGPHDIVLPGLINTHSHAAMTLFRGLADDLPLMNWLNDHIFPAEAKHVDADFVYLGSLLAAWEMARSGTTAFCDGYFFEDQVARAAKEVGLRVWLGEGLLKFPTPSNPDPSSMLKQARDLALRWQDDELVRATVFPHAIYTCTPEILSGAAELARELNIPLQIHLSETQFEVEQAYREHGLSPVAYLDRLGCLGPNTLAAHCVALSPDDIELLAARGVTVAHNAESNMKLASGIAPLPELLAAGVNVSLGTDGCASNNNLDLLGELASVATLHKARALDATVVSAPSALAMATINGARALNFAGGKLEAGAPADLVVLDGDAPNLVPVYNPVSHVVYAASGPNAKHVVVNGQIVVRDFRCQTIDEEALLNECRQLANHIRAKA